MCDIRRVSWWLIAGNAAAIVMLAALGIGLANAATPWAFITNIPVVAAVAIAAGVSAASFAGALAELGRCTDCPDQLRDLRRELGILIGIQAAMTIGLIAVGAAALVPGAGVLAITFFLASFLGILLAALAAVEFAFQATGAAYNECRRRATLPELLGFVTTIALVVIFIVVIVSIQVGISVLPLLFPGPG